MTGIDGIRQILKFLNLAKFPALSFFVRSVNVACLTTEGKSCKSRREFRLFEERSIKLFVWIDVYIGTRIFNSGKFSLDVSNPFDDLVFVTLGSNYREYNIFNIAASLLFEFILVCVIIFFSICLRNIYWTIRNSTKLLANIFNVYFLIIFFKKLINIKLLINISL